MALTSKDIIDVLNAATYPYRLIFFQQEQKIPGILPRVEVVRVQSDSNNTDILKTSKDITFEIRFYVKYIRQAEFEEKDRQTIETTITNTLEAYDVLPTGRIYFESKQWSHRLIDSDWYGSISTLRFKYTEVSSTSGDGIIGSSDILEVNSQSTPTQIKVLNISFRSGVRVDGHPQDDGNILYDPANNDPGVVTITYENTQAVDSLISSLTNARTENNGKLTRGGITTNYIFLFGETTKSNDYSNIEKATTVLHLNGTWA